MNLYLKFTELIDGLSLSSSVGVDVVYFELFLFLVQSDLERVLNLLHFFSLDEALCPFVSLFSKFLRFPVPAILKNNTISYVTHEIHVNK